MEHSAAIINYEVYVQEKGRWTLQMRFRERERDVAIAEAQAAERRLGSPVKVVRETYHPDTNTADEAVVYLTARQAVRRTPAPQPAMAGWGGAPPLRRRVPATAGAIPPPPSGIQLTFRILLVVAVALSVSIFVVGMASVAMVQLESLGIAIAQETYGKVIFVMFIAGFLFTAMPLSLYFLRDAGDTAAPRRAARRRRPPAPPPPPAAEDLPDLPDDEPAGAADADDEPPAPPNGGEAAAVDDGGDDSFDLDDELGLADIDDAQGKADEEEEEEDEEDEDEAQAAAREKARLTALRFLGEVVASLKGDKSQLDSYTRFGLHLAMAGAVEGLGDMAELSPRHQRSLLREVVGVLGAPPEMARSFADGYESYLLEARYLDMVRAGRDSLSHYVAGEERPLEKLGHALAAWNRPTPAQAGQRIVAVLFTDMVGSTDITQRYGDLGAQEVVRRHNAIVRQALSTHGGHEVKHTGDGIMASFPSAGEAVDAAVAIQHMVARDNHLRPDLPLRLRIGINAGEPLEEEDDLFGSTVQLAARVCDKAGAEEIFVTSVVRDLSTGAGRRFKSRGAMPLKGIAEPQPLFEALWREEDLNAEAAAGAAEAEPEAEAEAEADPEADRAEDAGDQSGAEPGSSQDSTQTS